MTGRDVEELDSMILEGSFQLRMFCDPLSAPNVETSPRAHDVTVFLEASSQGQMLPSLGAVGPTFLFFPRWLIWTKLADATWNSVQASPGKFCSFLGFIAICG